MAARFAPLTPDDPREVGGYALRARLGVGGMGRVYLSFTPGGRALAIKVIRPEHAEDEEFRRRFEHEVAIAQRVQGLYTAPVVDADSQATLPWLATAYVPGPSLRQAVIEHGPLPLPAVFRLLAGVAEGLAAVHACDLVHRDLTPANVLLADDGPRVIDFGIAHAAAATSLTRTGLRVGTPAYMAPEQVRGRSATPATDVFALGHLAVFAATGHPAFGEGNQDALFYRITSEPPNLDDCPGELRDIAERCLAKDGGQRPALDEIVAYARTQTQGQTMQMATGSWLPTVIATSLATYVADETHFAPDEKTRRDTKVVSQENAGTTVDQKPGTNSSGTKEIVLGIAGLAAVVAFFAIGPDEVFDAVGDIFAQSSSSTATDTTSTYETTTDETTTDETTTDETTTDETTTDETTTESDLPAGCSEAMQSIATFNRLPNSDDSTANAAQYRGLATGLDVAAENATDSDVISALDRMSSDFDTAADYLDAQDSDGFSGMSSELSDDADALLEACGG
jgi:serine/threonine protein kinase